MKRLSAILLLVCGLFVANLFGEADTFAADPNIYWGGIHVAAVNLVAAFGVDNTNATDAMPRIVVAMNALVKSGQIGRLPDGTYKAATPGVMPNNAVLQLAAGASVVSTMAANDGHTNTPFYADMAPLTSATTLNGTPSAAQLLAGTLTLTSATGYSIGSPIFVQSATQYYFASYVIKNLVGAVATVDRPIIMPFVSGDSVWVGARQPTGIQILADRGATLSGTGDRGIQLQSCVDCRVQGLTINSSFTSYAGSFDAGGQRDVWDHVNANFVANTSTGLALEGAEYGAIRDCEVVGAFTTDNIQFNVTSYSSAYDSKANNGVSGFDLVINAAGDPIGNRKVNLIGVTANGNSGSGINMGAPVQGLNVVASTTTYNQYGVTLGNGSDVSTALRIVGHTGGANTKWGLVLNDSVAVDGFDSQTTYNTAGVPPADGTAGGGAVLIQIASNVLLNGLHIDGGSTTPANWLGVSQAGSGTVTVTNSDIRGSNSSTTVAAISNSSTGRVFVDSSSLIMGGSGGQALWSQNGPFTTGPTLNIGTSAVYMGTSNCTMDQHGGVVAANSTVALTFYQLQSQAIESSGNASGTVTITATANQNCPGSVWVVRNNNTSTSTTIFFGITVAVGKSAIVRENSAGTFERVSPDT